MSQNWSKMCLNLKSDVENEFLGVTTPNKIGNQKIFETYKNCSFS